MLAFPRSPARKKDTYRKLCSQEYEVQQGREQACGHSRLRLSRSFIHAPYAPILPSGPASALFRATGVRRQRFLIRRWWPSPIRADARCAPRCIVLQEHCADCTYIAQISAARPLHLSMESARRIWHPPAPAGRRYDTCLVNDVVPPPSTPHQRPSQDTDTCSYDHIRSTEASMPDTLSTRMKDSPPTPAHDGSVDPFSARPREIQAPGTGEGKSTSVRLGEVQATEQEV